MLNRRTTLAGLAGSPLLLANAPADTVGNPRLTETLRRQSQALFDALPRGDETPWRTFLAEDVVITDESGGLNTKADLVAGMRPFLPRVTGRIEILNFRVRASGDHAVTTYVVDEHQGFYGARLHCQYAVTDTWRNSDRGWLLIASHVGALRTDPPAIALPHEALAPLVGRYELAPERPMTIALGEHGLTIVEGSRPAKPLKPEARDVFFVPGSPRYRYLTERDAAGRVTAIIERREAWSLRFARVGPVSP